ncbi:MAG: hypothetical protein EHM57_03265 [Actinobacteria bacterium]|nr:MAG: hypothetical protein EHM57_03265 [Actinomycetota bacterium]
MEGPGPALAAVDGLDLGSYHLYHAARADVLLRLGRDDEAAAACRSALDLTENEAERRFLEQRLAVMTG